jgi:hypothetical protein
VETFRLHCQFSTLLLQPLADWLGSIAEYPHKEGQDANLGYLALGKAGVEGGFLTP